MSATVIYTRRSSGSEDDSTSLETQEADCRALAASLGLTVDHVYREGVVSGATIADRSAMRELLDAVEAGKVATALAFTGSRISRNALEFVEIASISTRHGCTWRLVHSDMPDALAGTPMDFVYKMFAGWQAETERRSIMIATGRGLKERITRGGRTNGPKRPYGWESITLSPDAGGKPRPHWTLRQVPAEAAVVREMYERLAGGDSLRSVVTRLRQSDHPTPMGLPARAWSDTTVKTIIERPENYGRVVTGRYRRSSAGLSSRRPPAAEWVDQPNAEPLDPIVDEATWLTANAGIEENRKRSGGVKRQTNLGLLSYGLIFCACQDHKFALMWRPDTNGRYTVDAKNAHRHGCPQMSIRSGPLDEAVWQQVLDLVSDPNILLKELGEQVAGDPAAKLLSEAQARIRKLKNQQRNLVASIGEASSPTAITTLTAKLDQVANELERTESEAQDLKARAAQVSVWLTRGRNLFADLRVRQAELASLDLEGKRTLLKKLAVRVYIKPAKLGEPRHTVEIRIRPQGHGVPDWGRELGMEQPEFTWSDIDDWERSDALDIDDWERLDGLDSDGARGDTTGDEGTGADEQRTPRRRCPVRPAPG